MPRFIQKAAAKFYMWQRKCATSQGYNGAMFEGVSVRTHQEIQKAVKNHAEAAIIEVEKRIKGECDAKEQRHQKDVVELVKLSVENAKVRISNEAGLVIDKKCEGLTAHIDKEINDVKNLFLSHTKTLFGRERQFNIEAIAHGLQRLVNSLPKDLREHVEAQAKKWMEKDKAAPATAKSNDNKATA